MTGELEADLLPDASSSPFPPGGGELGRLIREFDWSSTELGPISQWPPALRTATNIVLQSPLPLVMLWGPNGRMIYNDPYAVFAAQRHPYLLGSKVLEGWPEVADFNRQVLDVCLAGGTLSFQNHELTLYRNNVPEPVSMNLNYEPVLGDDGRPAGVLAIVVETTAQVRAERRLRDSEEHLRLVNNELNHRVKNTLATIQALAAQTLKGVDRAARDEFEMRLTSLAAAHDLLTERGWGRAGLSELVMRSLRVFQSPDRWSSSGGEADLSPKATIALAMTLHELGTNATKHGAWSQASGRVEVSWELTEANESERLLKLRWIERDGPPVAEPISRGFGSRLIERGLSGELGGSSRLVFAPTGLACEVEIPIEAIRELTAPLGLAAG